MNIKQKKIKIEPRIKLNYNIYTYHMDTEFMFINLKEKAFFLGKERTLYICILQ